MRGTPAVTTPSLLRRADALLRDLPEPDAIGASASWRSRLAIVATFGALYGATMGCHGGRPLQATYSAVKLPLMLAASFAISLPPFFVVNTLFGLRDDFRRAVGALATAQAGLAVVLATLAPLTAFAYACGLEHRRAILLNGLTFAVASLGAQAILGRSYRALIAADPSHRTMLRAWLGVYVFVGIQMAWALRPFIGAPGLPTQFFREDGWTNAYVAVWNTIAAVFAGS